MKKEGCSTTVAAMVTATISQLARALEQRRDFSASQALSTIKGSHTHGRDDIELLGQVTTSLCYMDAAAAGTMAKRNKAYGQTRVVITHWGHI
jgi:hypothetical protein